MNTEKQNHNNSVSYSVASEASWYQAARGTAFVAATFVFIMAVLMMYNHIIIKDANILEPSQLPQLKAELVKNPQNDTLRNRIRDYDYSLRKEFFHRQKLISRGRYMLLVGVIILLICLKYIHSLQPEDYSYLQNSKANTFKPQTTARLAFTGSTIVSALISLSGLFYVIFPGDHLGFISPLPPVPMANNKGSVLNIKNITAWPNDEEIKRNWPRFRGPGGLGISSYTNIPDHWDNGSGINILWKSPVPLSGRNSPVVWGKRIFLTGATQKQRQVYCFDADTGKLLWQKSVVNVPGTPAEPPEVTEDTGFASPSAVTDGQRVYALFANGNLACFDFDGNKVWARNMGLPDSVYGFATSLVMYHNLVLIKYDQGAQEDGKSKLWAIDGPTGKVVWQKKRPVANSWSTPIIAATPSGQQMITSAAPWLIAYNPATGAEIWKAKCLYGDVAPSPYYSAGIVLAIKPSEELVALQTGKKGDISETGIIWKSDEGIPDIASPLCDGKYIFMTTGETLTCYELKSGKVLWQKDMGFEFNASPSLVGNKVYLLAIDGSAVIIKSESNYKEISRAKLDEPVYASPAFADSRMYIRGEKHLFCITKTSNDKNKKNTKPQD